MNLSGTWQEAVVNLGGNWVEEGKHQGVSGLVLRMLPRRVGALPEPVASKVSALTTESLEALAEALFDFQGPADLDNWLKSLDQ